MPATVSLLCICIAFVPMFGLGGVAGYLFRPLAEAVVFAMIASYILSRTLVPTMANFLLRSMQTHRRMARRGEPPQPVGAVAAAVRARLRGAAQCYRGLLHLALRNRLA